MIDKLHKAQDEDQVLDILWPPCLFQNMGTCEEILNFNTVQAKLSEIWQDTRTDREIALDSEFTLAKVFPTRQAAEEDGADELVSLPKMDASR